ncbi:LssY C-terminal domain-containing protein [Chamaesiphon sp.]|uniref:LssY C-terminal domain-containing protein n=1 Tax=Chamaesiphon sp. TaxID=2814140 RepID=UPI0035942748
MIALLLKSKIIVIVARSRRSKTAPVSNLDFFVGGKPSPLENRQQDLALDRPAGSSASQRHHVRFWQSPVDALFRDTTVLEPSIIQTEK